MTRLHDAFDALVDRGEPVGADSVYARARDVVANGDVTELQPTPMRNRPSVWIAAVAAICIAIVTVTIAWSASRQTAPADHPDRADLSWLPSEFGGLPAQLARQISLAKLGCENYSFGEKRDARIFPESKDESGCRVGDSPIVIASFTDLRTTDASIRRLLCSPSSSPNANRGYLIGDHWIIYPTTAAVLESIKAAVGGRIEHACS